MLMNTIVLRSALKYTNSHYTWFILKGQTLFSKTIIFVPFEICNYIFYAYLFITIICIIAIPLSW